MTSPSHALDAAQRSLRIASLAWSGLWLLALAAGLLAAGAGQLSWLLLGIVCCFWMVATRTGLTGQRALAISLIATGSAQVTVTDPLTLISEAAPAAAWLILAAVVAGFSWPQRRDVAAVAAVAAIGTGAMILTAWQVGALGQAWPQIFTVTAFIIGDGMAVSAGCTALLRAAHASDVSAEQLLAVTRGTAAAKARRESREHAQRVLHDTIVNTLGVIRRGLAPSDTRQLQQRCRQDVEACGALWQQGDNRQLPTQLEALRERARALGMTISESVTAVTDPLPSAVAEALSACLAEALLNASKHANVTAVDLHVNWTGQRLSASLTDLGPGWHGDHAPGRGIDRAITTPATEVGATAYVNSVVGHGTTVTFHWEPQPSTEDPDHALAAGAIRVASWITAVMVAFTALSWSVIPSAGSLIALGLLASTIAALRMAQTGRIHVPVPAAAGAAILACVVAVVLLPAGNAEECTRFGLGWWGGDAAVVALIALLVLTRGPWWAAAGALTVTVSIAAIPLLRGDCDQIYINVLLLSLGLYLAVILFRRAILDYWGQTQDNRLRAREEQVASERETARALARDRRLDAVVGDALPILAGIADATVDPHSDRVRMRCGVLEESLRTLLLLGPDPTGVADALADAVVMCERRDVRLAISGLPADPVPCPEPVRAALNNLVTALPSGPVTVVCLLSDGHAELLVTAAPGVGSPDVTGDAVIVRSMHTGEQTMIEISWGL